MLSKLSTIADATALAVLIPAYPAKAGSGTVTLGNSCAVTWNNFYQSSNLTASASTSEVQNCAQVQVKMHANMAGSTGWVAAQTSYINGSVASLFRNVDEKPAYSDHNGTSISNSNAQGFRKAF
jgi:hypothetical protein